MLERRWPLPVLLAGMFFFPMLISSNRCEAADASIRLTQVKASSEARETVDPALGDLGKPLKEKYPQRSFKLIKTDSGQASGDRAAEFALANGMSLSVKVVSVKGTAIKLQLTMTQGGKPVQSLTITPVNGATFLISVPWEKNLLVLAIRPTIS